jgi:hypothetical protein
VVAADQVFTVGIKPDLSVSFSPDHEFAKTQKGNLFHLIGLRPAQVTNNDTRHVASLICQVERFGSPVTAYTRDVTPVLRNIIFWASLEGFLRRFISGCAYRL